MLAFLNQYASLLTALLLLAVCVLFWLRMDKLQRQLKEYRRAQKTQQNALIERISAESAYSRQNAVNMVQMYQSGVRRNEERLDRMAQNLENRQNALLHSLEETLSGAREASDKRLGASFQQVSEQLERVHQGLGEMQNLAAGVGDLKRVLTGVKTRGIWGETRLAAILEQNLTPSQYLTDTPVVSGEKERVEFAVKLPGKGDGENVLLPIDSKFPLEDYHRLTDAQEEGDRAKVAACAAALENCVLVEAKRISDKYIRVPHTTDFAVMFLPVEGLYAEALRSAELIEKCRVKYHVILSGPTTLSALLSSLQMGFRSVAVEKRSEEIWQLLGSVREEFAKYGEAIERTRQRLEQASGELDTAAARTKAIHRRLRDAEQLEEHSPQP